MKKLLWYFVIITVSASFTCADYYIKQKSHSDSYYMYGVENPAVDRVSELWIGKGKIAGINNNRIVIIDQNLKRIFFVNRINKTYVEAPLPFDPAAVRTDQASSIFKLYRIKMTAKKTGETRNISGWECKGYEQTDWMQRWQDRTNESETKVWTTEDVPFDLELCIDLNINRLKLVSPDESFFDQLKKVKGFPVASRSTRYNNGIAIKSSREVVEISQKPPPEGIYSVPPGFTRKEKLSLEDVFNALR